MNNTILMKYEDVCKKLAVAKETIEKDNSMERNLSELNRLFRLRQLEDGAEARIFEI